jgi:peroxiredoxin
MLAVAGVSIAVARAYSLLGHEAPDFALRPAAAGTNVRLSEHRGEVVVLSFWSSSCTGCAAQLAALNESLKTYGSAGLQVFGVGIDDHRERAREFAASQGVAFPLLLDATKEVSRSYRVDILPMTVLIDRSGAVRHVHRDYDAGEEARYRTELRKLLNE